MDILTAAIIPIIIIGLLSPWPLEVMLVAGLVLPAVYLIGQLITINPTSDDINTNPSITTKEL